MSSITDCTDALAAVVRRYGRPIVGDSEGVVERPASALALSSTRDGYASAAEMDDEMLWAQMVGGDDERSLKIRALWKGETSAYGGDHSCADQALVNYLAW